MVSTGVPSLDHILGEDGYPDRSSILVVGPSGIGKEEQDSVVFALAEYGVHPPTTLATMEQLFDGIIEMKLYEEGLNVTPLIRVRKMRESCPRQGAINSKCYRSPCGYNLRKAPAPTKQDVDGLAACQEAYDNQQSNDDRILRKISRADYGCV